MCLRIRTEIPSTKLTSLLNEIKMTFTECWNYSTNGPNKNITF